MTKAKTTNPTARRKFKATYTKDEYKQAVRAAYKLGLLDGAQKKQKTLAVMQAANKHLVAELVRLDQQEPLDGVTIPMKLAEMIGIALARH
jgi:hypothetical protein